MVGDAVFDGYSHLGVLLRTLRRQAGLTQIALADLSRVGVRTIRDLELGRTLHPHRESARLLADALALEGEARQRFVRAAAGRLAPWSPPSVAAPPSQLPPDVPDFTGRLEHAAELRDLCRVGGAGASVAVITGPPGAGKTALAVHMAHEMKPWFPDGHLFVDLRGVRAPLEASDVLASFLHALMGDRAAVPATLHERIALYRTLLANRRVLLLLDHAVSERQLRPLLPGGTNCRTLITSRYRLAALEGVRTLPIGLLETSESVQLLARVAGSRRVAAEPAATLAVAAMCAGLPLAVRVAGARLAARPHWPVARLAELLRDERRRLDELAVGDLAVRTSIGSSYSCLSEPARRAFRLLAVLGAPDFAAWTSAPLLALEPSRADEVVEELVDAALLEACSVDATGSVRYRFHDLTRLYGQERSDEEDCPAARLDAVSRAAGAWLLLARGPVALAASDRDMPGRITVANPAGWFEAEGAAMTCLVRTATRLGLHGLAAELASVLGAAAPQVCRAPGPPDVSCATAR
jgi:transcriptional regulator with XRE-family HTH domain